MSEIRYTYTQILIVTCYLLLAVISACCTFAMAPLFLRSCDYRMNGPTTDLQRTQNGPTLEGVESYHRISLKPVLSWGNVFGMVFSPLHRFSCILNKVNLAGINAYCYAIETISRLYPALRFMHNNLIIFTLYNHKQD